MISLEVWYSREQATGDIANNEAELDAALDQVAALAGTDWPALATVSPVGAEFGPVLYVGFHLDMGALHYAGTEYPNSYFSLGQGSSEGEPLLYMYQTSASDYPPNCEIPVELARKAAHEFLATGRRPTCVEWQTWDWMDPNPESEWPEI